MIRITYVNKNDTTIQFIVADNIALDLIESLQKSSHIKSVMWRVATVGEIP